jgi:hypothetical protein
LSYPLVVWVEETGARVYDISRRDAPETEKSARPRRPRGVGVGRKNFNVFLEFSIQERAINHRPWEKRNHPVVAACTFNFIVLGFAYQPDVHRHFLAALRTFYL